MLELQHGHVVCINSILSQSPIPGAIDYCTSKASSLAFMESLTLGLLDCPGVGCTTVLPFHTNTEMFQGMRVRYLKMLVFLRDLPGVYVFVCRWTDTHFVTVVHVATRPRSSRDTRQVFS